MPDGIDGTWMSYSEAARALNISREAVRRRADRGHWAKRGSNEDRSVRILVPESLVQSVTASQDESSTRAEDAVPDAGALVSALEGHIATLRADVERLTAELAAERERGGADIERLQAELADSRTRADAREAEHAAQITAIEARLREETTRADQAAIARRAVTSELVGERAARRAGEKLAGQRDADITILRKDQAAQLAQLAQRDEQLAAARAGADRATADLVALAQRLAAVAEAQQTDEAAPDVTALRAEPPRRSRVARGWAWFLRN